MYIDIQSQNLQTLAEIRQEFPHTSFPNVPSDESMAARGKARVVDGDQPSYDPETQRPVLGAPYEDENGVWRRDWSVEDLPPKRVLTYVEFRDRFTAAEMAAVRAAVLQDGEALDWALEAAADNTINLDSGTTNAFLDKMVDAEILTAERKAALLA